MAVAPFLEHPVILFFLLLLVVGADAWSVTNGSHSVALTAGGHYIISQGLIGGAVCLSSNAGDPISNWIGSINSHTPSPQELRTLCMYRENLGTFGGIFTSMLVGAGEFSNIQALKDAKVSSWMLFILMIALTFLVWAWTASTRS